MQQSQTELTRQMQRGHGGNGRTPRGLGEHGDGAGGSERAVFYDLDAGSRRSAIQLQQQQQQQTSSLASSKPAAPNARSKPSATTTGHAHKRTATASSASGMLHRPSQMIHHASLLQLDASDNESHGSDNDNNDNNANPFASLLQPRTQQQPQQQQHQQPITHSEGSSNSSSDDDNDTSAIASSGSQLSQHVVRQLTFTKQMPPTSPPTRSNSNSNRDRASAATIRTRVPTQRSEPTARVEAADARPSRWATRAPARLKKPQPTASRRNAPTSRRSSLAMRATSSLADSQPTTTPDDNSASPLERPKRRRLADVLLRATLLSQQKPIDNRDATPSQVTPDTAAAAIERDDAIADTAHDLQREPFDPQCFSPSTLASSAAARRARAKPEAAAAASKIRGPLGDAIAKALRRTTRDLTLLHAHGQTLLDQQQQQRGSGLGLGLSRIQDRECVVVQLQRQRRRVQDVGDRTVFDGVVYSYSSTDRTATAATSRPDVATRVRVAFLPPTASQLLLAPQARVCVFAPFHFVRLEHAPGHAPSSRRSSPQWLLLGTTLAEMAEKVELAAS